MKKFLTGALMALMVLGFSAFTEASEPEQQNMCCGGGYYSCSQDCPDDGEYCGRYGCGGYRR